jgi:hypothetical protein
MARKKVYAFKINGQEITRTSGATYTHAVATIAEDGTVGALCFNCRYDLAWKSNKDFLSRTGGRIIVGYEDGEPVWTPVRTEIVELYQK